MTLLPQPLAYAKGVITGFVSLISRVNFAGKGETFKLADQNKMAKSFYDKTRDGTDPA